MDWAGPPGGLEQLFRQYDTIVSRHPAKDEEGRDEEPPWWTPEREAAEAPEAAEAMPAVEQESLKSELGYDPTKSWRDIDAGRMEAAEKRLNDRFENPSGATFKQDEEGMANAYSDVTAPGVYYDPATRTEYVKGSSTARDWFDDFTKIPFWGDTRDAERYQQADQAYKDLHAQGKPVDRIVGHSLGGSVALQMQKDRGIPQSRTFGAPVLDLKPFDRYFNKAERYRHPLDPVSVFDRGATWGSFKPYSHSYTGFGNL